MSIKSFSQKQFSEVITHPEFWIKGELSDYSDTLNIKTFNFNPILNSNSFNKRKYLEFNLETFSSTFLVFKSDKKEELKLTDILIDEEKRQITTKRILKNNEKFIDLNSDQGIILNYNLFSILNKKENHIRILSEDIIKEKDSVNFLEVIYYPNRLNSLDRAKVETYLSLKHGISLSKDKVYVNSLNDTLWNPKENNGFNQFITGIGSDEKLMGFKQLQSVNSQGDLVVGFNKIKAFNSSNNSNISDNLYLIWGANKGETVFPELNKGENFTKLKKVWKFKRTKKTDDSLKIQFKFLKNNMKFSRDSLSEAEKLYLAISPSPYIENNLKEDSLIPLSKQDNSFYYFNNIDLTGLQDIFYITLVRGPRILVNYTIDENCFAETTFKSDLQIEVIQGLSPFHLNLNNKNFRKEILFDETLFSVSELEINDDKIYAEIRDSKNNVQIDTIDIEHRKIEVLLEEVYYLENSSVLVEPKISGVDVEKLQFEWINLENNMVIGEDSRITLLERGNYQLKITTRENCEKMIPFSIESKKQYGNENISIFPNPVKGNSAFNISLNFIKDTSGSVEIRDYLGRLIWKKNFEGSNHYEYSNSLRTSGTYLIYIIKGQDTTVKKLIIQ